MSRDPTLSEKLQEVREVGGPRGLSFYDGRFLYLNLKGGWYGHCAVAVRWWPYVIFWWSRPREFGLKVGPLWARYYPDDYRRRVYSCGGGIVPGLRVEWRAWVTKG